MRHGRGIYYQDGKIQHGKFESNKYVGQEPSLFTNEYEMMTYKHNSWVENYEDS